MCARLSTNQPWQMPKKSDKRGTFSRGSIAGTYLDVLLLQSHRETPRVVLLLCTRSPSTSLGTCSAPLARTKSMRPASALILPVQLKTTVRAFSTHKGQLQHRAYLVVDVVVLEQHRQRMRPLVFSAQGFRRFPRRRIEPLSRPDNREHPEADKNGNQRHGSTTGLSSQHLLVSPLPPRVEGGSHRSIKRTTGCRLFVVCHLFSTGESCTLLSELTIRTSSAWIPSHAHQPYGTEH